MPPLIRLALVLLLASGCTVTKTINIGPQENYKTLSEVDALLKDGDIVEISPGVYNDCATLTANRLTIRPKDWLTKHARVRFQNVTCNEKAIFLIYGDNIRIEGIEFANAQVPDGNGAGIKLYGADLELHDTHFSYNEMGLLTGSNPHSEIIITQSTFQFNGRNAPGWGHGVYAGKIKSLHIRNSEFKSQKTGHHIKSRADFTEVTKCRIQDGTQGTASYSIDLSNGGSALITDNVIQKGPNSDNVSTAICIACEGASNISQKIVVTNNQFINNSGHPTVFLRNLSGVFAELKDNEFEGDKTILQETKLPEPEPAEPN